jgi:3-hydroxyisobutyrate dehydrogenase-like beta-hydroxyacid dehydrogenase
VHPLIIVECVRGERATLAVLHPGEMGARVAGILRERGHRVLGLGAGRSAATRRRAEAAGIEEAGSLPALAARAEIVLSLVPPDAAEAIARRLAAALPPGSAAPLFADLNSIAPGLARRIGALLAERGVDFVDGAIHGQARELEGRAVLLLSGPSAPRVARLFEGAVAVRCLGPEVGAASGAKMLLSCVSKTLVALCLELGAAAREAELGSAFWELLARFYPELASAVERMAPTLPRHAARRVTELVHAEATLRALGCDAGMVRAARRLTRRHAGLPPAPAGSQAASRLPELIETLRAARPRGDGAAPPRREPHEEPADGLAPAR